jgi:hypothetical protein
MPIPLIGAVGLVGKLFGGVIKKIKANKQVKKAKKAEARAKELAAKSVAQLSTVGNKLFSISDEQMTPAQNAVFSNVSQENIVPDDNRGQMAPDMLKKYGVYFLAGIVILILFKFLKR